MRRRFLSLLLLLALLTSLALPANGYDEQKTAADRLYALGLFNGVGNNPDGSPNYALDRSLSRQEAVTMLVRLLGKEQEAKDSGLPHPFADVDNWAAPYVGYAYCNGLTNGMSDTTFGGSQPVTATQYLTFVLRALGYVSGSHFAWDAAWELTDLLNISNGQYHAGNNHDFLRGDAVAVSAAALDAYWADGSGRTLLDVLREQGAINGRVEIQPSGTQANLNQIMRQFVRDMMAEGGDFIRTQNPADLGVYQKFDLYYEDAAGTAEDALLAALQEYLAECLDGDYGRNLQDDTFFDELHAAKTYPWYLSGGPEMAHAFVQTDGNGIITAYGFYEPGDPESYTATRCWVDSTQLVALLRDAPTNTDPSNNLIRVDCEMVQSGNSFICTFYDLPDNAVWMRGGTSVFKRDRDTQNWDVDLDSLLQTDWKLLMSGVDPKPIKNPYTTHGEDSKYPGVASRLFVFLDADYNMIAYALGQIHIN